MRRTLMITALIILPALAACSQDKTESPEENSAVTQTRMDDIDKIEGTISDEMIDTSETDDPAPLDGKEEKASQAAPSANDSGDEAVAGEEDSE